MKSVKSSSNFGLLKQKSLTASKIWFLLAIYSLAVAGLFSLPPVILRKTNAFDPATIDKIFTISLVIHVDLSVLVWLLAITCSIWSLTAKKLNILNPITASIGAFMIAVSPFFGETTPYKNNYIPMLQNHVFIIGLALFFSAIILQVVASLRDYQFFAKKVDREYVMRFGIYSSAIITASAIACFIVSYIQIKLLGTVFSDPEQYYEMLFWAGGHILQFVYIQMLVFVWLWLAEVSGIKIFLSNRQIVFIYFFGIILTMPVPLLFSDLTVNSIDFTEFFTNQMKYFGGVAAGIVGTLILFGWISQKSENKNFVQKSCLILSIIIFGIGGMLGYHIEGSDARVPAHYHGSIVGITLAFMGFCYDMLPRYGYLKPKGKMFYLQPFIFGVGQLSHILGLAMMGGYGALRKAPGTSASIDTAIGKILFFSGGGLAIIGGFLFVIVAIRCIIKK